MEVGGEFVRKAGGALRHIRDLLMLLYPLLHVCKQLK